MAARYSLQWAQPPGNRRGVSFLDFPGKGRVNMPLAFDDLDETGRDYYFKSFDLWVSGKPLHKRYHGWPSDPDHSNCFVFRKSTQRLYGFLTHPFSDRRFQLCVLTVMAEKHKRLTDSRILNLQEQFRADTDMQVAILRDLKE